MRFCLKFFFAIIIFGHLGVFTVCSNTGEVAQSQESSDLGWSEYGIIDIHAHIGSFRGFDLKTETLLSNLRRFDIRLALISNIDGAHLSGTTLDLDEKSANQMTLETVQEYPGLLRALAWARPSDPDGSPANIEPFLRDHGFVGVKLHPDMNQFAADDAIVDGYLELCAKYEVPAVFHCGAVGSNSGPEKIYTAAKRRPTVAVIFYHMGFTGAYQEAIATVKESIEKKDANLYLGTAQADPQFVLAAVKELGADRVLFGTDATYYGQNHYEKYADLVNLLHENLSESDFAKVMHGNAIKLFRFGFLPEVDFSKTDK